MSATDGFKQLTARLGAEFTRMTAQIGNLKYLACDNFNEIHFIGGPTASHVGERRQQEDCFGRRHYCQLIIKHLLCAVFCVTVQHNRLLRHGVS